MQASANVFIFFCSVINFGKKNSIDGSGTLEPCPSCPAFQLSKMTTACTMVSLNFPRGKGFDGMSEQTHYRRDSQRKRPQSLVKMQMSESNGTHRLLTNCIPLKILQVLCGSFTCWEHIIRGSAHYIFHSSPYVVFRIHNNSVSLNGCTESIFHK